FARRATTLPFPSDPYCPPTTIVAGIMASNISGCGLERQVGNGAPDINEFRLEHSSRSEIHISSEAPSGLGDLNQTVRRIGAAGKKRHDRGSRKERRSVAGARYRGEPKRTPR